MGGLTMSNDIPFKEIPGKYLGSYLLTPNNKEQIFTRPFSKDYDDQCIVDSKPYGIKEFVKFIKEIKSTNIKKKED